MIKLVLGTYELPLSVTLRDKVLDFDVVYPAIIKNLTFVLWLERVFSFLYKIGPKIQRGHPPQGFNA